MQHWKQLKEYLQTNVTYEKIDGETCVIMKGILPYPLSLLPATGENLSTALGKELVHGKDYFIGAIDLHIDDDTLKGPKFYGDIHYIGKTAFEGVSDDNLKKIPSCNDGEKIAKLFNGDIEVNFNAGHTDQKGRYAGKIADQILSLKYA
jgi:hypothetical protein